MAFSDAVKSFIFDFLCTKVRGTSVPVDFSDRYVGAKAVRINRLLLSVLSENGSAFGHQSLSGEYDDNTPSDHLCQRDRILAREDVKNGTSDWKEAKRRSTSVTEDDRDHPERCRWGTRRPGRISVFLKYGEGLGYIRKRNPVQGRVTGDLTVPANECTWCWGRKHPHAPVLRLQSASRYSHALHSFLSAAQCLLTSSPRPIGPSHDPIPSICGAPVRISDCHAEGLRFDSPLSYVLLKNQIDLWALGCLEGGFSLVQASSRFIILDRVVDRCCRAYLCGDRERKSGRMVPFPQKGIREKRSVLGRGQVERPGWGTGEQADLHGKVATLSATAYAATAYLQFAISGTPLAILFVIGSDFIARKTPQGRKDPQRTLEDFVFNP
ncbi:hypothetical protein AAG570_008644 [Ranatra chinensis]|uniref:Uncharacterized protein n=1 Tax=Ranatra chinensis TaxID=642074 RepID=A0ABD0YRL0_9HEMI